ncbi:MAG: hypothetical protein ACXAES_01795 [Promethearchaeota archaeon]|jgi:hypothetical protein
MKTFKKTFKFICDECGEFSYTERECCEKCGVQSLRMATKDDYSKYEKKKKIDYVKYEKKNKADDAKYQEKKGLTHTEQKRIENIDKLLKYSERRRFFSSLVETHLLQARSSCLRLKLKEARNSLAQAQNIAEKYGLQLLARKISDEHDQLLGKSDVWEELKRKKIPLSERLNDKINLLLEKRIVTAPELIGELPVLLLIIAEGGIPVLSHSFSQEAIFEDDTISSFLSAFNSFSEELFSMGLDRAKFGEFTIVMDSINSFSVCYLFKGQSYLAKQKILQFAHRIQNTTSIWQVFTNFHKIQQTITLKENPIIESLITEVFITKSSLIST